MPSVWPLPLVLESTLTLYGSLLTFVVTAPSGPTQWLNASFAAVPTATGGAPLCVPLMHLPEGGDALFAAVVVPVTFTPLSLRAVSGAGARCVRPPLAR